MSPVGLDASTPPDDRYRIVGRIAAGGMAEIYLARMLSPSGVEREVVLKRLMPELQADQEFVQMFYDEANLASRLRHPNIVQIFELGELDGSLFIAMELLRGANLRDLLARLHLRNQPLPIPMAVRIACSALDALDYAHRFADPSGRKLNVVHRDVSPQNIIVTYDGTVKLVDFGVAKAEGRLHQTRAGLIKGKFAYMSPEQVSGGKVDGRSDLFALAEVFYELLLRRHPFYATSDMEVLRAILDKDPPHPNALEPNFPAALGEALMKAMRKAPGDRFATAGQMQDALERFLQESRTPATTAMLGRFMSDLFADRVDLERHARESADDDALIEALTAGRAEEIAAAEQQSRQAKRREPQAPVVDDAHPTHIPGEHRDRVVEIARGPAASPDPAEPGAPAFLAHSGYTNPGALRQRFSSQVRNLFEDPAEGGAAPAFGGEDRAGPTMPQEPASDDAELPTMLGTLSAAELAELRGVASRRGEPEVSVGPGGPRVTGVVVSPADPAVRGEVRITRNPPPDPRARTGPATPVPQAQVTPRSRTVVASGGEPVEPVKGDRLGLLFFIAGLGALVGAVAYAVWLYTSQSSITEMQLETTPPGASILLDGADTGARTPHMLRLPSDRPHAVEFQLEGYEPCARQVPASSAGPQAVTCALVAAGKPQ